MTSLITWRTASICASGLTSEPSTTCTSRSASTTSSSVERNASTSWVGRCRTNPTVSVSTNGRAVGEFASARCGFERCEQRVLHEHTRAGQRVEQAGLACVGVADDRDRRHVAAQPAAALGVADLLHVLDLAAQLGHPFPDATPVRLDLRLAGAAQCPRRRRCRLLGRRPGGTSTRPSRAAAAACTPSAPASPAPCPPGWWRAGRRCRGSARCGR